MNDLLLTVVVIAAVIAFGALISAGNERQRRAIDALHQAYKQWAVQDLRLKRGTVSSQIRIEDFTAWLTKVTSLALGHRVNVMDYQVHHTPIPTIEFHIKQANPNLRFFVVVGPAGSGKTTLLKSVALELAASASQRRKNNIPDLIPIVLYLREAARLVMDDPHLALADIVNHSFERFDQPLPTGWLDRALRIGRCVVMLDGLDEIVDPQQRHNVVLWIESQMRALGKNIFIVTSRPHGYASNPLSDVSMLEVLPFNSRQVDQFINNWYLANEIASHQADDAGVRMAARSGADDLIQRIRSNRALADLAVNPLLLTMIATVHRYRSALPGRQVELYAEIAEVFLGKRHEAKGLGAALSPAQKSSVLRALAFYMMEQERRDVDGKQAISVIERPLAEVNPQISPREFIVDIESGGLFFQQDFERYGFSHRVFQEYFAAVFCVERRFDGYLSQRVNDPWWQETIHLYCAMSDASNIIDACIQSGTVNALQLAVDCLNDARSVQPEIRRHFEVVMERLIEEPDPDMRRVAATALQRRRLQ